MNFSDLLSTILSSMKGAKAVILMGYDGILVADAKAEGFNLSLQDVSVEYSRLLIEATKIAQGNDLGNLSEFALTLERFRLVFRVVDSNYFLLLVLSSDANLGKGRYLLRRSIPEIQAEL